MGLFGIRFLDADLRSPQAYAFPMHSLTGYASLACVRYLVVWHTMANGFNESMFVFLAEAAHGRR